MKRMIPIIMILLSLAAVTAVDPCPFAFSFITSPPDANVGLTVQLKYGDRTWIVPEGYPGEYVTDLGGIEPPIANCIYQNFELTVKDCEANSVCHSTVSFNPQGYTTLDISSANLFKQTTTSSTIEPTTTTEPTTTIPITTTVTEECEECEVCPDETINYLVTGITAAIASAGLTYAYGLKIRKPVSGGPVDEHMHPGIVNYHSINTVHTNLKIRHPKGMVAPKYEKIGTEWKYKGV